MEKLLSLFGLEVKSEENECQIVEKQTYWQSQNVVIGRLWDIHISYYRELVRCIILETEEEFHAVLEIDNGNSVKNFPPKRLEDWIFANVDSVPLSIGSTIDKVYGHLGVSIEYWENGNSITIKWQLDHDRGKMNTYQEYLLKVADKLLGVHKQEDLLLTGGWGSEEWIPLY